MPEGLKSSVPRKRMTVLEICAKPKTWRMAGTKFDGQGAQEGRDLDPRVDAVPLVSVQKEKLQLMSKEVIKCNSCQCSDLTGSHTPKRRRNRETMRCKNQVPLAVPHVNVGLGRRGNSKL